MYTLIEPINSIPYNDRWYIYQRLCELDINIECFTDGALYVQVDSQTALIQVWSVVYRFTTVHQRLADRLERCLQNS